MRLCEDGAHSSSELHRFTHDVRKTQRTITDFRCVRFNTRAHVFRKQDNNSSVATYIPAIRTSPNRRPSSGDRLAMTRVSPCACVRQHSPCPVFVTPHSLLLPSN